jgi:DUF1680 family protein
MRRIALKPVFLCLAATGISMAIAVALASAADSPGADTYKTRLTASDPATWKPVVNQLAVPTGGITLDDAGLFKPVLERNIQYLLESFSVNHLLVPFRQRAGQKDPPDDTPQVQFWDTDLRGSNAGRFLMGAGNTLRWIEHPELRKRLNELIDGVEACREPNGYILAYPPNQVRSEEPNYGRAWFTHGLIEAAIAGNPKAYGLLRGHADWFNQWDMLPKLIYHSTNSHQGHIASTRTYFTPIGKPEDLQVAEKYYVMDWWINELAAHHGEALWRYPLQNPHSYLITSFEAYLDHYRATGDLRYLDAVLGGWDLIHDDWEHVGGSMAIFETHWRQVDGKWVLIEKETCPPRSYYLAPREPMGITGETCGTVFWVKLNQRLHQLYPDQEKYTAEIEKSLYNVALANQTDNGTIRYHSMMQGKKENCPRANTCCEGQGTRLNGSLPEYIYSIAADGLYVDLFEPSTISWKQGDQPVSLKVATSFPFNPKVSLRWAAAAPIKSVLRVRVPAWAVSDMPIAVNGQPAAIGKPGSYVALDRTWSEGDTVTFSLPADFHLTRYTGDDKIEGHDRYALEYGPILMAVAGPLDDHSTMTIHHDLKDLATWLKPMADRPLHFTIDGDPAHEVLPYWQITDQTFCTFPVIESVSVNH